MTKKGDEEKMEELLHGMVGELVRCAKGLGVPRQAIINALTSRLITLGFEESGDSAAVAAWFRQTADAVALGKIKVSLDFDKTSTSGAGDPH